MKKLIALLLCAAMCLALTACGSSAAQESEKTEPVQTTESAAEPAAPAEEEVKTIVFKAAQESDAQNSYGAGLEKLAELVEEKSGGRYKLEVYHAGQLGTEAELIEGVTMGTVDICCVTTSSIVNFLPDFGVFDLPFMFEDLSSAYKVLDGEVGQNYLDMIGDVNAVGLRFWANGFRSTCNKVGPIETAADFAGIKMRTMNNAIHIAAFEAMDAIATPMAYGEVYTSIQQGVVDGMEAPLQTIYSSAFYEVAPYVSVTEHVYSSSLLLMSEKARNSIPEEDWAIFEEAINEATVYQKQYTEDKCDEGVQAMIDAGCEVNYIDDKSSFVDAVSGMYSEYYEVYGQETIEAILAAAKE